MTTLQKTSILSVIVLILVVLLTRSAWGNPHPSPPDPGDAGIFFDEGATTTGAWGLNVGSFFSVYVAVFDPPGGIGGFELGVSPDPRVFLVGVEIYPPGAIDEFPGDDNWVVSTGVTCLPDTGPVAMIRYDALLLQFAEDILFCLEPAQPSRFSPASPGYHPCGAPEDWRPFTQALNGGALWGNFCGPCVVGNPLNCEPPIALSSMGWGALKSRYQDSK